jgi:hypothetical protein
MLKEIQVMEETKPRIFSKTYQGIAGLGALSFDEVSEPIIDILQVVGLSSPASAIVVGVLKFAFAIYALWGRESAGALSGIFQTSKAKSS